MIKNFRKKIIKSTLACTLFVGTNGLADDSDSSNFGKLPRGDGRPPLPTPQDTKAEAKPSLMPSPTTQNDALLTNSNPNKKATLLKSSDCLRYMASPSMPRIWKNKQSLYYLAPYSEKSKPTEDKKDEPQPTPNAKASDARYTLLELNTSTYFEKQFSIDKRLRKVFSLEGNTNLILLPHGPPVDGFSVLSIAGSTLNCLEGNGVGVTIPLPKAGFVSAKPVRTIGSGHYTAVESDLGRVLHDTKRGVLEAIDPGTFQHRILFTVPQSIIPLYWTNKGKSLIALTATKPHQLKIYANNRKEDATLKLERGESLIQNGNRFATFKTNVTTGALEIFESAAWTGRKKNRIYSLNNLSSLRSDDASVHVDFDQNLAIILKGNKLKSDWRQLLIVDLNKKSTIGETNLQPGDVFDAFEISSGVRGVFLGIADKTTKQIKELKFFDVKGLRWHSLTP